MITYIECKKIINPQLNERYRSKVNLCEEISACVLKYFYYPSEITDYLEDHIKVENLVGGHCEVT